MSVSRSMTASMVRGQTATHVSQTLQAFINGPKLPLLRTCGAYHVSLQSPPQARRQFSTTRRTQLKEYFEPPKDLPSIRVTGPAWKHPAYSEEDMNAIQVSQRECKNWRDRVAMSMVKLLRFGMDTATWYTHDREDAVGRKNKSLPPKKSWGAMTERKWLVRFLFLESVAGVPGMVGASLRHLHSLRRMKRDNGWIETLLEEAYNERMHLLTFMKMAEPGWFMKVMILGAQGVFYNGMFLSYLISPQICHRFVGHLEEEAVRTYTRAISDIDCGKLPGWDKMQAPEIAIKYWNMPEGKRSVRDMLLYIRADEAKHREVNHTLGNLEQKNDPNPFISEYKVDAGDHPSKGIENIRPTGWERQEVL